MTDRELMQQALEALEQVVKYFNVDSTETKTIIALRERLAQPDPVAYWHSEFLKYNTTSDHRMMENAQGELERIKLVQTGVGIGKPEQEPVAWLCKTHERSELVRFSWKTFGQVFPLYTTPPQRKPLTDEEISDAVREADFDWHYGWTLDDEEPNRFTKFARAIEAKLKEKNT